jgi:hypothetical protein
LNKVDELFDGLDFLKLGFWETIYNLNFKPVELDGFKIKALEIIEED